MTRHSFAMAAAANHDGRTSSSPQASFSGASSDKGGAASADDDQDLPGGFTISDLAQDFGVTLRTLRFYESRGLLAPARSGMTRIYSARDKARLALILKGKQLGFTLVEIRAMLANEEKGRTADIANSASVGGLQLSRDQIVEQLELLRSQRSEIEGAITELEATLTRLGQG